MDPRKFLINDDLIDHEINKIPNQFVAGWYNKDTSLLDDINNWWETQKALDNYEAGMVGSDPRVDKEKKDGIETILNNEDLFKRYYNEYLTPILHQYILLYPHSSKVGTDIFYNIKLQEYPAGSKGYSHWHAEIEDLKSIDCHLVFMTYLNDVTDGGDTQFWYQNLNIKPEKGLTLIFPAAWTHTHRGLSSATQDKKFLTGWWTYGQ